jgi:hypothetical protein
MCLLLVHVDSSPRCFPCSLYCMFSILICGGSQNSRGVLDSFVVVICIPRSLPVSIVLLVGVVGAIVVLLGGVANQLRCV